MKLKSRIVTAFCVFTIVPVILLFISVFAIGTIQMQSIKSAYGIDISFGSLINSVQTISMSTKEQFDELKKQAEEDSDRFLNFNYLQQMNSKLDPHNSYLLIMKEGELFYSGTDRDVDNLTSELASLGDSDLTADSGTYIGHDARVFIKNVDLKFSDGTSGEAYIVTMANKMIPQIRVYIIEIIISVLVILIFTAGSLSLWIYRGLVSPISNLREATKKISDGDLDFTVQTEEKNEIGDLCRDFESMRKRLKESEEEKARYDRDNKELISNISHDLKTPITTVKGYVEGIMDGVADTPEKMDRYIRTIYNKANDMDRLINELTFYSKIDANRIPYSFTKLNVAEYFGDCAEEEDIDLNERGIKFTYVNETNKDTLIIADPEQLKRVIDNIVGNSVKYMDKPYGMIELRIRDVGDFIQVEIEDNGKGIEAKNLANIFDRFYRTDSSRNSERGGSGIGLSIVKKIIEDHGGKIWASSRIGHGTTMHFVLRKDVSPSV